LAGFLPADVASSSCWPASLPLVEHITAERARADEWASTMARNRAQLLPRTPAGAVAALLSAIADDDPAVGCGSMSPAAGDQLAAALGVQDCPAAVAAMHGQVVDPAKYESPDAGSIAEALSGDRAGGRVNACALTWRGLPAILGTPRSAGLPPGPQLGVLDVQREQGAGYRVTAYGRCPASRTRQ
jgi:hypothetical protein